MEHQKIKQNAIAYDNLIETQAIKAEIEHLLRTAQDGIIAFDPQGKIIAINEKASVLFGKTQAEFINHDLWQSFKLNSFSHKRQYIQARQSFLLAKEGIAQQFTWLENKANKPILAYNIMINKAEIHGTSVLFARITDILQTKILGFIHFVSKFIYDDLSINK